jgi:H+/Cl- antiporter ClcA
LTQTKPNLLTNPIPLTELPLYLLLGLLCGCVSVAFTRSSALATQGFDRVSKKYNVNPAFLPPVGGLCVGLLALAYPEVLYWGFENLDVVLQSRQPPDNPLAPTTGGLLSFLRA